MSIDLNNMSKDELKKLIKDAEKALKLIDALEDNDDVQNVFHNIEMNDVIAALMN
mgnify:CR=1 FL=1